MSKIEVDKVDPQSGTALEIGTSGDTITVPTGAGLTVVDEVKTNKISPATGTAFTLGDSGDTFTVPSGATFVNSGTATGFAAIAWQSVETGATFTAVAGNGYPVNTTAQACTVTLPASASVGDQIIFTDYARNWATNALTINPNSLKYQGNSSPNPVYDTNGESVHIVYMDVTNGWIPINDGAVALETPQNYDAEYLVIAGGGGGGKSNSGGGGGGGHLTNFGGVAIALTPGTVYTCTVGAGGTATTSISVNGGNGEDSVLSGTGISTVTSIGGGGGSSASSGSNVGADGGSGGGSASGAAVGAGTVGQGNDGGTGYSGPQSSGGGGGGAGAVGVTGLQAVGGNGGAGLANSITGASVLRAGGGGGTTEADATQGSGGTGGGGNSSFSGNGSDGTANTGGGGGGVSTGSSSGAGGVGVIILRMADADYSGVTTGSPSVATGVSGDTVITFTGDGSYTA